MYTCAFNVLHDTWDKNVNSVRDNVNLDLCTHHILVNENRVFNSLRKYSVHIRLYLSVVINDAHILSTDNVGGTEKHGIADHICRRKRLLECHNTCTYGALDIELFKERIKLFTVLSGIYSLSRRTEDLESVIIEELCKLDSGLSAKRNNYAYRLLYLEDIHNVLGSERLKVKSVCGIVVCRYCLGVVVYDNNVITERLKCPYAVNG